MNLKDTDPFILNSTTPICFRRVTVLAHIRLDVLSSLSAARSTARSTMHNAYVVYSFIVLESILLRAKDLPAQSASFILVCTYTEIPSCIFEVVTHKRRPIRLSPIEARLVRPAIDIKGIRTTGINEYKGKREAIHCRGASRGSCKYNCG